MENETITESLIPTVSVGTLRGDAIQEISKMARRGREAPRKLKTSRPDTVLIFNDELGKYETVTVPEPARFMSFRNINSLIRALHDVPEEKTGSNNYMPHVFYSRNGISAFYGLDAHHKLEMNFHYHTAFTKLLEWGGNPRAMSQSVLIQTLRTIFRTCYETSFLEKIRNITWSNSSDGRSSVEDQGRSMHTSVVSKILGTKESEIPDTTTFTFAPVFEFPRFTVKITCYVVIDSKDQSFVVCPYPGEMENAYQTIEAEVDRLIGIEIGELKTPRYIGTLDKNNSEQ